MKEQWELWVEDKARRDKDFLIYLKSKKVKKEGETQELIRGHLEKADHNLKFVQKTLDLQEFNDWAIVSTYYAIYHASLALCALRGYSTEDHLATLLILIREFYQRELNKEDLEMVNTSGIEKEHLLYYVEAKKERTKASYSTQMLFNAEDVEKLRKKAITFVNKVKEIIDAAK